MNWGFNLFPMVCLALNNLYPKITGRDQSLMKIWVNNEVWSDLEWAMGHLHDSLGVKLLSSVTWEVNDADEAVFCEACMHRLAFWYPACQQGYYVPMPPHITGKTIFFHEAIAVTSTIDDLCRSDTHHIKIVLCFCMDTSFNNKLDLCVLHIPSVQNKVADAIAISRKH